MGEPIVINVSAGPINGGRKTAPYFACLLFPPGCSRSASRYCLVLIPTAARKMLLAPCASRSARNFACASRQTQRKGLLLVPQAIRSARRFAVPSSPPQCKGFLLALQSGQSPRRFAFPLNPTAVQGVLLAAQPNRSARRFACALPSHAARHSRLHLCKDAAQWIALAPRAHRGANIVPRASTQPQCKAFLRVSHPNGNERHAVGALHQPQRGGFCSRCDQTLCAAICWFPKPTAAQGIALSP